MRICSFLRDRRCPHQLWIHSALGRCRRYLELFGVVLRNYRDRLGFAIRVGEFELRVSNRSSMDETGSADRSCEDRDQGGNFRHRKRPISSKTTADATIFFEIRESQLQLQGALSNEHSWPSLSRRPLTTAAAYICSNERHGNRSTSHDHQASSSSRRGYLASGSAAKD